MARRMAFAGLLCLVAAPALGDGGFAPPADYTGKVPTGPVGPEGIAWGKAAGGIRVGLSPKTILLDPGEKTFTVRVWYENVSRKAQVIPVHKDANLYKLMFAGSIGPKPFYVGHLARRTETIPPRPRPLQAGQRFSETFTLGFIDLGGRPDVRFYLPGLKAGDSLTLRAGWTPFNDAATAKHWNDPRTRTSGAITVRRNALAGNADAVKAMDKLLALLGPRRREWEEAAKDALKATDGSPPAIATISSLVELRGLAPVATIDDWEIRVGLGAPTPEALPWKSLYAHLRYVGKKDEARLSWGHFSARNSVGPLTYSVAYSANPDLRFLERPRQWRHWTDHYRLVWEKEWFERVYCAAVDMPSKGKYRLDVHGSGAKGRKLLARQVIQVPKAPVCYWVCLAQPPAEGTVDRSQGDLRIFTDRPPPARPAYSAVYPVWVLKQGEQFVEKRLHRQSLPGQIPSLAGWFDFRLIGRATPSKAPLEPPATLKLSLENGQFVLRWREAGNCSHRNLLGRWWVNDKPIRVALPEAGRANRRTVREPAEKVGPKEKRVRFGLPKVLGPIKPGDKIALRVMYCPEDYAVLHPPGSYAQPWPRPIQIHGGSSLPVLSNRLEFRVTQGMVNARQAGKLHGPARVSWVGSSIMDVIGTSKMVFVGKVVDLRWQKATVRRIKMGDFVGTTPETRRGTAVFECTQAIRGVKVGQRVTLDVLKDICEFGSSSYLTEAMVREWVFKDIQIKMGSQWLLCVSDVPRIDAIAYVPTGKEPIIGQVRQLLQLHAMPPEKQLPKMVNILRQKRLSEGNPLVRYALDHVDDDPHRGRRLQTADVLNAGFLDKTNTPRVRYLMLHGLSHLVTGGDKTELGEQVSLKIKRLLLEDAVAIQSAEKGLLRSYVHELAARFGLFEAPDASPVFPKDLRLTRLGGAAKALRSIAGRFGQYAAKTRERMEGIPGDSTSRQHLARQIRDHLQKKDHCLKLAAGLEKHTASAISDLIKALSDKVATVRWKAAEALGRMEPSATSAIPALINALSDEVDTVRWKAAEALGTMGPSAASAIPALIKASNNTGGTAEALGRIGPAAIPALIEALKEEGKWARYRAADALGRIGPKARSAVPALGRAMRDQDPQAARMATSALARIGPAAVATLLKAARDQKNKTLRRWALYSLGQVKPPGREAVAVLIGAVKDGQRKVAVTAAIALGDMGSAARDAVPTLNRALIGGDRPSLRQAAAYALWEITPSGREILLAALRHPALHVRRFALPVILNGWRREQVRAIGGPSERLTRTVARALSTALSDSDPEVRYKAAEGLGHMGTEAVPVIGQLIAMLGDQAKYYPIKTASRGRHGRPMPPPGFEVYSAAMGTLTGIGAPAIAPLAVAAEKAAPTVRRRIYLTLIGIAQHDPRLRQSVTAQLQRLTGEDIGPDMAKWIRWLVKQPETGKTTPPPVDGKVTTPNAKRKADEQRKKAEEEHRETRPDDEGNGGGARVRGASWQDGWRLRGCCALSRGRRSATGASSRRRTTPART